MKKIFLSFFIVLVLFSVMGIAVSADTDVIIKGASVTAKAGETIDVPIVIEKNSGFCGLNMQFTYPDGLTYVSLNSSVASLTCTNSVTTIWDGSANYSDIGELAVIKVTVPSDAEDGDSYSIKINFIEAYDYDLNDVSVSVQDATVTVSASAGGCLHANTKTVGATSADCSNNGYTAGVYCNDCETYISGHEVIPANGTHEWGKWYYWSDDEIRRTCMICGDIYSIEYSEIESVEYPVEGGNIYFIPLLGEIAGCDSSVISADIPSEINGEEVKGIGSLAFYYSDSLKSVTIPDTVTYIDQYAFEHCEALESVSIPDSVSEIRTGAFNWCLSLKSINIPQSVTKFGTGVFDTCESLETLYYAGTEEEWNNIVGSTAEDLIHPNTQIVFNTDICRNHVWGNWVTITEATYYEKGQKNRYCKNCNFSEIAEIEKLVPTSYVVSEEGLLPFEDVADGKWYTDSVKFCYANEIVSGVTDYTFEPGTPLTRGMFVVMLSAAVDADVSQYAGKSSFKDVKTTSWYANAVEWAYRNGYVSGMGDGYFSPKSNITRQQMCVLFKAYMENNGYDVAINKNVLNKYSDKNTISSWAKDGVIYAVSAGLMNGTTDTTISPKTELTRAQATTIMMQFLKNYYYGKTCSHNSTVKATCTESEICSCGMILGLPNGHYCADLSCNNSSRCYNCGQNVSSSSAKHKYKDATCTEPKTCSVCQDTVGSALGHNYTEATCTAAKKCKRCGGTSGSALGHNYVGTSCTKSGKCSRCSAVQNAYGHNMNRGKCSRCGYTDPTYVYNPHWDLLEYIDAYGKKDSNGYKYLHKYYEKNGLIYNINVYHYDKDTIKILYWVQQWPGQNVSIDL